MNLAAKTKSANIRARLNHPVIDCDGHAIEFVPLLRDYVREIAGPDMVETFRRAGIAQHRLAPTKWHTQTPKERQDQLRWRRPFYAFPAKNTLDRATAMLPKLMYERMDAFGVDFSIIYPTAGLDMLFIKDDEIRRVACRALNRMNSDLMAEYADRMTPVATIPTNTPEEGVEELEYAVKECGMKAIMISGNVHRQVPMLSREAPQVARHALWYDHMAMDSLHDYDPFWAKCVELKVAPTAHAGHQGIGSHKSISSYVYNHIGSFAEANHAFCKAVFLGGVSRRFPTLKFGFLEGGVGWACSLYADIIGHWEKRNKNCLEHLNPANIDKELLGELFRQHGGRVIKGNEEKLDALFGEFTVDFENPEELDEFKACGVETKEDIRNQFVPNFFFGCEADDPLNAWAFKGPLGDRLNAMFSSDIAHWDVPDMSNCVAEAYELVEDRHIDEEDFSRFMFANPAGLHAGMNPDFFKGTIVEGAVDSLLANGSD